MYTEKINDWIDNRSFASGRQIRTETWKMYSVSIYLYIKNCKTYYFLWNGEEEIQNKVKNLSTTAPGERDTVVVLIYLPMQTEIILNWL